MAVVRGEILFCSGFVDVPVFGEWAGAASDSDDFWDITGASSLGASPLGVWIGDVRTGVMGSSAGYLIASDALFRSCDG